MRESVAQRRDMALIDDGRESTTPVEPTSGLGGEFRDSRDTLYDSTDSISRVERDSESEDEDDADSNIRITVIYNTRLWAECCFVATNTAARTILLNEILREYSL